MKHVFGMILMLWTVCGMQAQEGYVAELRQYREKQEADFLDADKSPLSKKQKKKWKGHDFYPINPNYRVEARFEATPDSKPFPLGTNKGTSRLYKRIGILHFEIEGEALSLEAYLRIPARFVPRPQKKYVFLPVIDATTGDETYGAGRYLHFEGIPEGDTWTVDFNKLYNPYCAYNEEYECPKVPEANHLNIPLRVGVKDYKRL